MSLTVSSMFSRSTHIRLPVSSVLFAVGSSASSNLVYPFICSLCYCLFI